MVKTIVCSLIIKSTVFINTCYVASHIYYSLEIRVNTFNIKRPVLWLSEVQVIMRANKRGNWPRLESTLMIFLQDYFVHLRWQYNLSSKPGHIWRWKRTLVIITWESSCNMGIPGGMASLFHPNTSGGDLAYVYKCKGACVRMLLLYFGKLT